MPSTEAELVPAPRAGSIMLSAALAASAITAILFMEFLPNYSADFVRHELAPV
jgi:hypothetical protein